MLTQGEHSYSWWQHKSLSLLTVIDTNDGTDHLRDDEHVPEMSLDSLRLFSRGSVYPALTKHTKNKIKADRNGTKSVPILSEIMTHERLILLYSTRRNL